MIIMHYGTYGTVMSNIVVERNGHEAIGVGQFLGIVYGNGLIDIEQGCESGSAKNLPLPHRLFDLRVIRQKSFVRFPMWIKP